MAEGDKDAAVRQLRSELRGLRAGQLRKRAAAAGVSAEAIDEAEDAVDEKAALIELLVSRHQEMGVSGQIVSVLQEGGEAAAEGGVRVGVLHVRCAALARATESVGAMRRLHVRPLPGG